MIALCRPSTAFAIVNGGHSSRACLAIVPCDRMRTEPAWVMAAAAVDQPASVTGADNACAGATPVVAALARERGGVTSTVAAEAATARSGAE